MKPTVGRIVHYYNDEYADLGPNGVGPYAAIITTVHSETVVDLDVFPDHVIGHVRKVAQITPGGEGGVTGWCWPPRE